MRLNTIRGHYNFREESITVLVNQGWLSSLFRVSSSLYKHCEHLPDGPNGCVSSCWRSTRTHSAMSWKAVCVCTDWKINGVLSCSCSCQTHQGRGFVYIIVCGRCPNPLAWIMELSDADNQTKSPGPLPRLNCQQNCNNHHWIHPKLVAWLSLWLFFGVFLYEEIAPGHIWWEK